VNTDEKSAETLKKISRPHPEDVVLAGEPEAQAGDDAGTVIELETAMAKLRWITSSAAIPRTLTTK